MNIRAFIAIELGTELTGALHLLQKKMKRHLPPVRWVRPELIHLTLKFLGYLKEDTIPRISEIVSLTAEDYRPFSVRFSGVSAFPHSRRPRVIWVGVEEEGNALQRMVEGHSPTARWLWTSGLAVLGLGILVGPGSEPIDPTGVFLALGAGAAYAVFATAVGRLTHVEPIVSMAVVFGLAAVLLLPALAARPLGWAGKPDGLATGSPFPRSLLEHPREGGAAPVAGALLCEIPVR